MIIIRYGEIGLKSPQTRRHMEDMLIQNIEKAVRGRKVLRSKGRLYLDSDDIEDARGIARVFGVVSTSVAVKTTSDKESIVKAALTLAEKGLTPDMSFGVRVRRTGSHDYKSPELAGFLGKHVKDAAGASVDLTHPDWTLFVEVRGRDAYLFDEIIPGVGGLPLGTQGRAVALVSGGIDSPVAAWMMMRRGLEIEALFMDCRPLVDDRTIDRARATLRILSEWTLHPIKTHVVSYGDALMEFLKYGDHKLGCVLCKRMMYLVAEKIALERGAKGILSGDSLGQVASQTLDNMRAVEEGISLPVFRPLVGFDKTEIIDAARRIGSYEASIQPANCCLGPPIHPETRASVGKVRSAEEKLDMAALVEKALANKHIIDIGD